MPLKKLIQFIKALKFNKGAKVARALKQKNQLLKRAYFTRTGKNNQLNKRKVSS
jgi:hypothetical protein